MWVPSRVAMVLMARPRWGWATYSLPNSGTVLVRCCAFWDRRHWHTRHQVVRTHGDVACGLDDYSAPKPNGTSQKPSPEVDHEHQATCRHSRCRHGAFRCPG